MKVLLYRNKLKDVNNRFSNVLINHLDSYKISYEFLEEFDFDKTVKADAMIVIGGDGTILNVADFANKNDLPILGINAGRVGFLTDFESYEIEDAVKLLKKKKLKKEARQAMLCEFNGKKYLALNEVVVQRIFNERQGGRVVNLEVSINGCSVDTIAGDGVIVCTPTGSTAYSLSASGAILTPDLDVFSVTPICAHSLHHRPIIYSADSTCSIKLLKDSMVGVVVDGKYLGSLSENDNVIITKSLKPTTFLRKQETNFFDVLIKKLNRKLKNV